MKVRRHAAGFGGRARVRPWAFDDRVVQLNLADQAIVPRRDEVERWVDALVRDTADLRVIRTGALFSSAAARFREAGFVVIDTLALLRIELAHPDVPPRDRAVNRLSSRHHGEAALVDRAAFGDPWGNDARDLADIRRATPAHHAAARFAPGGGWGRRELAAFALTGAASGQGYLQRLAVAPQHQRRGHGRALALDALHWMQRRGLTNGVVNTAVTNAAALGLYESIGFRRLPEQLVVMQLDVAGGR